MWVEEVECEMDRRAFYDHVRDNPFGGSLSQSQVDGMEALLDEAESRQIDPRWLAYILGTTFHEVARTMQPIEEYGKGRGRPYGRPDPVTGKVYYGRGFVQITWKTNYQKMSDIVGVDLVSAPEKTLDLAIATKIIFEGMIRGSFTGRKLSHYFTSNGSDWYNARRIVNRLDRASLIAGYGRAFYRAILAATTREIAETTLAPMPEPESLGAELAASETESVPDVTHSEAVEEEAKEMLRDLGRA